MAIYFLNLQTLGRSRGTSAVSAAAYRAGERIRDERTGRTYDHSDRQDVLHKEIVLPGHLADSDMSWAKERAQLWNAAERAESRKDARVAREYLVALPVELNPDQRVNLVRGFSKELVDRYRFALDLVVHAPRDYPGSDPRNFHAHLLATTREVTTEGLAAKTTLELRDSRRRDLGLEPVVHELLFVRERWATVTNEALRQAQVEARVDHRSLAAQGIDREPYPYIPRVAFEMERHGYRSGQAERLRTEYQARVQARAERQTHQGSSMSSNTFEEISRQVAKAWAWMRQKSARVQTDEQISERAAKSRAQTRQESGTPRTVEEGRRQSVENWQRYRRDRGRPQTNDEAQQQSIENWRRYRREAGTPPTADDAVENWRRWRQESAEKSARGEKPAAGPKHSKAAGRSRSRDDDFGL